MWLMKANELYIFMTASFYMKSRAPLSSYNYASCCNSSLNAKACSNAYLEFEKSSIY